MAKLTPVDFDPFAGAAGPRLVPVEGDPFAEPKAAEPRPSAFRMDSDFKERAGLIPGQMLVGAAKDMFGSRQGAAEYLARKANEQSGLRSLVDGGAKVVTGEDGEPMIRLADGTTYRTNDPGIDSADVANIAGNVAAFWTPASWASAYSKAKGLGLVGRSLVQGGTAAATDAGIQAVANEGKINPLRTAAAAAGGAGGEVLGQALGAVASKVSQLLKSGKGSREAAMELANQAGIPQPSPEVLARLSAGLDEIKAGADPRAVLGREQFGFLYTQGQRLVDPARRDNQLVREELLRQAPGGRELFQRMGAANAEKLDDAVSGIATQLGGRGTQAPGELAAGAGTVLRNQADDLSRQVGDAYDAASKGGRAAISTDAVQSLPSRLTRSVRDFGVNPQLHPAAAKTLEQITESAAGLPPNAKGVTLQALESQRRIIGSNYGAASNPADRAAMSAIKREFDGFMDEAIETALIKGDPSALDLLKKARGLRAEFGRRFEGSADTDKFIAGILDGSRTPEEVVNIALGASQVSKAGGARFIQRLRAAANDDPTVMGNLRAAHFSRLARGRNGEPLPPGQIVRNIRETEFNNASVVKALYGPEEWARVRQLAAAIEPMLLKGDLARTSGSLERAVRMLGQRIGGGLPLVGETVQGVLAGRSYLQAGKAINAPVTQAATPVPRTATFGAAGAGEMGR